VEEAGSVTVEPLLFHGLFERQLARWIPIHYVISPRTVDPEQLPRFLTPVVIIAYIQYEQSPFFVKMWRTNPMGLGCPHSTPIA
jgi:hypothetical protein